MKIDQRSFDQGKSNQPLLTMSLFPNPAYYSVNVIINSPAHDEVTLLMTDVNGKLVKRQERRSMLEVTQFPWMFPVLPMEVIDNHGEQKQQTNYHYQVHKKQ